MTERAKQAGLYFVEGYNCAQAVAISFEKELGMERSDIARLVSSFGGGMGRMREVCGAVSGALLVLGWMKGYSGAEGDEAKMAHYARVQEFARRFKEIHGSIICREMLKGVKVQNENSHIPEKRTEEYYRTRPCAAIVEDAVIVLEQILAEDI
ncbi:MAG: C_GCAxxG_C_C family protein [Clostridia bacterium]|nr:C_GCAxxG_C_C family protein [Clostridia bacterium]